jgi:vancomycin resistance protein YoaR
MAKKKKKKAPNKNKKQPKNQNKKQAVKKATPKKNTPKKAKTKKTKELAKAKQKEEAKQEEPKKKWFALDPSFKHKLVKDFRKPIIVAFTIIGIVAIFVLSSIVITFELLGKALPGTRVAGIDVGALTLDEIQVKLMERGQPFLEKPITIKLDEKKSEFLPSEIGISLLPRNTLQEVHFVEFENTNLGDILKTMWIGHEIPFYVSVDVDKAAQEIESRFEFNDKKAKNAYLTFEENELVIVPEKQGKAIDLRALYLAIKNNANNLSSDEIVVELVDQPPLITKADLEQRIDSIKETLNKKIVMNYENWNWPVYLIDHVDWIEFKYSDELNIGEVLSIPLALAADSANTLPEPLSLEREIVMNIEEGAFLAYVEEEMTPVIEVEAQDVKIYQDDNEKIVIEGRGENGREIKKEYLIKALELAANNGLDDVPIPVHVKKANAEIAEELKLLGIETLIGTGRSAFAGSPTNRIHNIGVGVSKFNGVIIPPGEEFSFNEHLGPVDASTGYKPELVIKAEGTIPEYGGGLCQVSSTMYRAALLSGLPIIERSPHSYAVSYYAQIYGYGLDATIYPGVRDVKFLNDTPGYILVQSYTEGSQAFFKFYGTDDGRIAELEGPYLGGYHGPGAPVYIETTSLAPGQTRQVEYGHTGFNATWYRYLTKNGETIKETIYSKYRAIPAKILIGAGGGGSEE